MSQPAGDVEVPVTHKVMPAVCRHKGGTWNMRYNEIVLHCRACSLSISIRADAEYLRRSWGIASEPNNDVPVTTEDVWKIMARLRELRGESQLSASLSLTERPVTKENRIKND